MVTEQQFNKRHDICGQKLSAIMSFPRLLSTRSQACSSALIIILYFRTEKRARVIQRTASQIWSNPPFLVNDISKYLISPESQSRFRLATISTTKILNKFRTLFVRVSLLLIYSFFFSVVVVAVVK